MWEWFLPFNERQKYYSQIMEGSGGGGGPLEPQVIGWLWGFLFGGLFALIIGIILYFKFGV